MNNNFFNVFEKEIQKMDDAEFGREVKKLMSQFKIHGGNVAAHINLAAKILVFCTHEVSAVKLEQEISDLTVKGENVGSFKVTVEKS